MACPGTARSSPGSASRHTNGSGRRLRARRKAAGNSTGETGSPSKNQRRCLSIWSVSGLDPCPYLGVRRLRAEVTHRGFRSKDDWDTYWARYAQFMQSAVYDGAHDLFVRSPDGRGASACTIWLDEVNAECHGIWKQMFDFRIGVNSGDMVVAAYGSRRLGTLSVAGARSSSAGTTPARCSTRN